MILGPNGQPLEPSRPEPRVTARFATADVGHIKQGLRLLAMACGVRFTSAAVAGTGVSYKEDPDRLECEVYGRERDVERYMDAVRKWSEAAE